MINVHRARGRFSLDNSLKGNIVPFIQWVREEISAFFVVISIQKKNLNPLFFT